MNEKNEICNKLPKSHNNMDNNPLLNGVEGKQMKLNYLKNIYLNLERILNICIILSFKPKKTVINNIHSELITFYRKLD